ncbi:XdhC family protein [Methylophilus medardicus]|uniref:XdhC family protein n=1 Tax=Methylophilus medardicus TaxID=2588534 RepID=A0A5B8CPQ9_9PROT|nr:XdhC family protein [Methylophilus medardicus]QDC43238.1 XdhC family protein [Methylophilus medardicus]QDC48245.1 XdhC family protein [Methylophilus medardicus]QDC51950.1 XdhC family protein [Methylophilus medardicus]
MQSSDWEVLQRARDWLQQGHRAHLFTVIQTWGSAPRLPGAILVVRDDGHLVGSVSGGCIEDDLADQAKHDQLPRQPAILDYGINQAEAQRFGIPCGGQLKIFAEPLTDAAQLTPMLESLSQRRLLKRSVHVSTGEVRHQAGSPEGMPYLDGDWFHSYFGPQWRLLIIGANQLGAVLAAMAQALDFHVMICDPREEMRAEWHVEGADWLVGMPDDVVLEIAPDPHTAIVAVTHDPKLDDMALLEALKSQAFYIGALGSTKNQEKRKQRLRSFDLSEQEVQRLHGPVGLRIGSRTPAEIAVSILAELIQTRAQVQQVGLSQASTRRVAA